MVSGQAAEQTLQAVPRVLQALGCHLEELQDLQQEPSRQLLRKLQRLPSSAVLQRLHSLCMGSFQILCSFTGGIALVRLARLHTSAPDASKSWTAVAAMPEQSAI